MAERLAERGDGGQDVAGMQVTMHDAMLMEGAEPEEDIAQDSAGDPLGEAWPHVASKGSKGLVLELGAGE